MDKPIEERTLGEIKDQCNNSLCNKCDLFKFCGKFLNTEGGTVPAYWNFENLSEDES